MNINQIRDIEERLARQTTTLLSHLRPEDVAALLAEVRRLRQGLYECAIISGVDTDGNTNPDSLTHPDIVEYATRSVQELRDDYNEELAECSSS